MSCVKTLRGRGFRLTPQRLLIADVIHDNAGSLTAAEIVARVQAKMPGVNKSTIYRTLGVLEEAGCVYKVEFGKSVTYHHDEAGHGYHLVCVVCGKTVDCDERLFSSLKTSLMQRYGFDADFGHLTVSGICAECGSREG